MSIADRLASALGRRDEQPNIDLAADLAARGDSQGVAELAGLLTTGPKPLAHDAVKALYETAERNPALVAPQAELFLDLLSTRDNRMLWGAMSALAAIAPVSAEQLMQRIDDIFAAADRGSVIAMDKAMTLAATLNADPRFNPILTPVLIQRLRHAAVNQTPMYAELVAPSIAAADLDAFVQVIEDRRNNISHPAKKTRLDKLLRKLEKRHR